jgi:hypothetical protein
MISLKSFIHAIQDAIVSANHSLMEQNEGLLEKYFESAGDEDSKEGELQTLKAKSVVVEYPHPAADGKFDMIKVHVPLITLVPLAMSQIEKAKLSVDFEMKIINNELQLNFPSGSRSKKSFFGKKKKQDNDDVSASMGHLEITLSPHESSEGLKEIVEGYENVLKSQIPH